jgi:TRAP-type uncharacterized transport system substrate-binding protein
MIHGNAEFEKMAAVSRLRHIWHLYGDYFSAVRGDRADIQGCGRLSHKFEGN